MAEASKEKERAAELSAQLRTVEGELERIREVWILDSLVDVVLVFHCFVWFVCSIALFRRVLPVCFPPRKPMATPFLLALLESLSLLRASPPQPGSREHETVVGWFGMMV